MLGNETYEIEWKPIERMTDCDGYWIYVSDYEDVALVWWTENVAWTDNFLREKSHVKPIVYGWGQVPTIPRPEDVNLSEGE